MTPRVAVVHPQLVAGGGSEACALWTLQALQDESRLTLITMGRPDLGALNRKYGTTVDANKIEGRFLRFPPERGNGSTPSGDFRWPATAAGTPGTSTS